jgi:hypothetical protein
LLHGIQSSEMVTRQTPHIAYLSAYGIYRRPLVMTNSKTKSPDFLQGCVSARPRTSTGG